MISALASVVAQCRTVDVQCFVDELIELCFLEEQQRDAFYKAGSEAMAVILEKKPDLLGAVLRYIDRRIDHLDNYAVDILTNAPLSECRLGVDEVGSIMGKWLVNRPVDHPASAIARRVLGSLNWACTSTSSADPTQHQSQQQLFLPSTVHEACADTVVKAHIVHCKNRNNLISKSVQKAAKLALKTPDLEQQFDRFCWDVLLKLKIGVKVRNAN